MKKNKIISVCWVLFLILTLHNTELKGSIFASTNNLELGAGLSNMWVIGDNLGSKPLSSYLAAKQKMNIVFIGGGFNGVQVGLGLFSSITLDSSKNYYMPFGIDLTFFDSRERFPVDSGKSVYEAFLKHDIIVSSLYVGLQRNLFLIPYTGAHVYAGFDLRANIFATGSYSAILRKNGNDIILQDINTKPVAVRFGGSLKLGIHGNIVKNVIFNPYVTVGVMNILGRNNNHGELLTPTNNSQDPNDGSPVSVSYKENESYLSTFQFCLLLQFKM
ncbi:MAG: hypothetical protein NT007_06680 [Candidatus Kapabacteria bacterium]|nr:hypothetical protein [Candidatus Kapabacteria bacterium]